MTIRWFTKRNAISLLTETQEFRKRTTTRAVRIDGPFTVVTREGEMHCPDGWLAFDANGDPYPIAADVFAATYEPV